MADWIIEHWSRPESKRRPIDGDEKARNNGVKDQEKTREDLLDELRRLRLRCAQLEARERELESAAETSGKTDRTRNEEPLRTIFENARSGMFIIDAQGRYVAVNPAACELSGYAREEILSSDTRLLTPPEDRGTSRFDPAGTEGAFIPERLMRRKDGSDLWVEVTVIPFRAGSRELALEIRRDITERRRAENALQQAHVELERCVEKRTDELKSANKQLKREIEERRRAEEELKRTKEYLENAIETSVDAIGIVDLNGRFILWNRRAEEIYGYSFDEMAGKSAFDLYADTEELARMLKRFRRDGVVREYEIPMKKHDGSIVPMDISLSVLRDDRERTIGSVCVARDLSERKRAEAELKRAKDELSLYSKELERQVAERTREITGILKYTPSMVYIKDNDGCYRLINSRCEELFGIRNDLIRGKSDFDIFPKEVAEQFRATDLQVLIERRPCQVEEHIPQEDGIHTYLSVKFPLYDEERDTAGLCGILTDITELKKAQVQLRRLSGSIMAGQEKERAAIARELHDELGQVLTALRMDAVWILKRLSDSDSKAAERAQAMCDLIDKTIDEVRGIALRLRPGVLDDLGLVAALEWYTAEFEKRTGIACILKHSNLPKVDELVSTAAYRIAQEAVTNVARHTSASHVEIALQAEDSILTLTVVDNGCGFNAAKLAQSEGLGVAGMRERASLAGGTLEVQSQPGKGTQVLCRLPARS
jgi:PAS domain S-box-containing protein